MRLVAADGLVLVDRAARHPGRGAYLCPSRLCARLAERRRALPRRLRAPVGIPATLEDDIESLSGATPHGRIE